MFSSLKKLTYNKWGAVTLVIFLIIIVIFIGHLFQPKTSRIQVEARPVAEVFINGVGKGQTPLEVKTEETEIIVRLEFGQEPTSPLVYEELIRPEKGTKVIVRREVGEDGEFAFGETILLAKIHTNETMSFKTSPQSARIFINDELVGTSPLKITAKALGVHKVRAEADGHTPREFEITVVEGFETRSLIELRRRV